MDLVHAQMRTEDRARLRQLAREHAERMFLDLVCGRVHLPVGGVRVTPLGAYDHGIRRNTTSAEPRREKRLRQSVGARGVEVPNACGIGGIEHLVRTSLHRVARAIRTEVLAMADVDV